MYSLTSSSSLASSSFDADNVTQQLLPYRFISGISCQGFWIYGGLGLRFPLNFQCLLRRNHTSDVSTLLRCQNSDWPPTSITYQIWRGSDFARRRRGACENKRFNVLPLVHVWRRGPRKQKILRNFWAYPLGNFNEILSFCWSFLHDQLKIKIWTDHICGIGEAKNFKNFVCWIILKIISASMIEYSRKECVRKSRDLFKFREISDNISNGTR